MFNYHHNHITNNYYKEFDETKKNMDKLLVSCSEVCQEITTKIKGKFVFVFFVHWIFVYLIDYDDWQQTGNIPEWLNVELIRLGPGKWDLDDEFVLNHWLDGCALLCKFSIKHGCVKYVSKFLESDAYRKMVWRFRSNRFVSLLFIFIH